MTDPDPTYDPDLQRDMAQAAEWSAEDHKGEVVVHPDPGDGRGPYVEIPLTKGQFARVSPEDYQAVSQWRWRAYAQRPHRVIARRRFPRDDGRPASQYMHTLLLPDAQEVDHRNGDPRDNRRGNIRAATNSQNAANVHRGGTSEFNGVHWLAPRRKWRARISVPKTWLSDGQRGSGLKVHLGLFESERDAGAAYDAATLIVHGELARPNVPEMAGSWPLPALVQASLRAAMRDPHEPVCETCGGDQVVRVYTGRAGNQTMPCPACVLEIPEAE